MTVGELIEELREYPEDFMVVVPNHCGGYDEAGGAMLRTSYGDPNWERQVVIDE